MFQEKDYIISQVDEYDTAEIRFSTSAGTAQTDEFKAVFTFVKRQDLAMKLNT